MRKKAAAVAAAPSSAALKTQHGLHRDQLARLRLQRRRWNSLGSPIVPLSPPPCPHKQMRGEAATRTRCSAARWFRSLVLALSKCLVAAAPKIRPVVSIAPAGCVAGPADCKMLDWLPHFLRRERSNGRVAMQMQLDWQESLPLRAPRLLPCVVTLGLASNTPRRRPLNSFFLGDSRL